MKHLSAQDAMFLHLESPEMPMHVGSLCVLDMPAGMDAADFYEHAKQRLSERLHLADLFTRKLALIPFDLTNPVWVDDEDVDLDYHVRHVALPRPGTNRQLQQYVARLHSSLLDRSRPLWEFFIISGLKSGQAALYTKAHHAGMDGQGGIAVAQSIFDMEPAGRVVKPPRPRVRSNRYQLGFAELAGAAARNMAAQVIQLAQGAPAMLGSIKGLLTPARDEDGRHLVPRAARTRDRDGGRCAHRRIRLLSLRGSRRCARYSAPRDVFGHEVQGRRARLHRRPELRGDGRHPGLCELFTRVQGWWLQSRLDRGSRRR
ncbi:MAG: hypothetical protein HC858_11340 [Brachymonas sp.]|nr:hypothetical protein [Brachymonas sp.]